MPACRCKYFIPVGLVLGLLQIFAQAVAAREEILDYRSRIEILPNGVLDVTENIEVRAEGRQIRRGIYRDFPTRYRGPSGEIVRTGFDIQKVLMNNRPVAWRTEHQGNGIRLYIGDRDVFLDPGVYTYLIQYRSPRQIKFLESRDELYFNAVGTNWTFPILKVRAEVIAPRGAAINETTAYVGGFGEDHPDFTVNRTGAVAGRVVFEASRPLAPREGMSIVVSWPSGFVERPGALIRAGYLLRDNLAAVIAWSGVLAVLAFYLRCWHQVGRDPRPGVIIAQYEPPQGFSPAGSRFVMNRSYDDTAFTAAIVNMAVKGYLTIDDAGDEDYTLRRAQDSPALTPGERAAAAKLFDGGQRSSIQIHTDNYKELMEAKAAHENALEREHLRTHFVRNRNYFYVGIAISVFVTIGSLLAATVHTWLMVVPLAIMWLSNLLFGWLLKRPTIEGRKAMDEIAGFRRYLQFAEKDRMNFHNPPERTPELFERYLPFAIALGIEHEWGEQFDDILAKAARDAGQSQYQPSWYHGGYYRGHFHAGQFAGALASGFTAGFSSAASPPSSSSGFSGGFAGGGGGGGGGGGW